MKSGVSGYESQGWSVAHVRFLYPNITSLIYTLPCYPPKCMCKSLLIQTQKRPGLKGTPDRLVNPEQDPFLTRCQVFKHRPPLLAIHYYLRISSKAPN